MIPETVKLQGIAFVKLPSGTYVSKDFYSLKPGASKNNVLLTDFFDEANEMSDGSMQFRPATSTEWMNARRHAQDIDRLNGIDYLDEKSRERGFLLGRNEMTCTVVDFYGKYPVVMTPQKRKTVTWLPRKAGGRYFIQEWDEELGLPCRFGVEDPRPEFHGASLCIMPRGWGIVSFKEGYETVPNFRPVLEMERYETTIAPLIWDEDWRRENFGARLVAEPK